MANATPAMKKWLRYLSDGWEIVGSASMGFRVIRPADNRRSIDGSITYSIVYRMKEAGLVELIDVGDAHRKYAARLTDAGRASIAEVSRG